jgi:hypothetical protein
MKPRKVYIYNPRFGGGEFATLVERDGRVELRHLFEVGDIPCPIVKDILTREGNTYEIAGDFLVILHNKAPKVLTFDLSKLTLDGEYENAWKDRLTK